MSFGGLLPDKSSILDKFRETLKQSGNLPVVKSMGAEDIGNRLQVNRLQTNNLQSQPSEESIFTGSDNLKEDTFYAREAFYQRAYTDAFNKFENAVKRTTNDNYIKGSQDYKKHIQDRVNTYKEELARANAKLEAFRNEIQNNGSTSQSGAGEISGGVTLLNKTI